MIDPHNRLKRPVQEYENDKEVDEMKLGEYFWGKLSKQIIIQLYSVYKIDFEMLQYEYPQTYIEMGY